MLNRAREWESETTVAGKPRFRLRAWREQRQQKELKQIASVDSAKLAEGGSIEKRIKEKIIDAATETCRVQITCTATVNATVKY